MARARKKEKLEGPAPRGDGEALRGFVSDFFAFAGCEARSRNGDLVVALTPELQETFGAPELVLAFHARDLMPDGAHLIQPGSVLLERMVTHLRERVGVSLAELAPAVPPDAVLPAELSFACQARLASVEVRPEEYVTFNFRISYVCDEKNEEILPVTVDSDGTPTADPALLALLERAAPCEGAIETGRRTLGALYGGAEERARRHAEETARRYEQETLPRLYRAIARLRAFYQAQIAELDPQQPSEADLRDAYERDLRLRTEEEISNHRMSVSLSLVNFRVARVPRACYSVRLSTPHARRSHVFERDLVSGALLPTACDACGADLAAVDLCAGGHLVCPDCLHPCCRCERPGCASCGMEVCGRCGEHVCSDCRTTCAACENVVCSEHCRPCPVCEKEVCDACLGACAACGKEQCAAHLVSCGVCGASVCLQCAETCAACGERCCPEHTGTCGYCGQLLCSDHLGVCRECGAVRCLPHLEGCSACGARLCEAHRQTCGGCGAPVCEEHAEKCAVCGDGCCPACGPACALSGRRLCPEHAAICAVCGRTVAPDYTLACSVCGETTCAEHARECAACGTGLCERHAVRCQVCDEPFCERCAPVAGLCSTCSDPQSGDEVPASEVMAVEGLPEEWRARVPRAGWRRVRKRQRVVYYGLRLFRLMVVTATPDGRFTGGKAFSLLGRRFIQEADG